MLKMTSKDLKFDCLRGFCGALSAFSGTIGDIADVQFGCAPEDSTLDVPETPKSPKKQRWERPC